MSDVFVFEQRHEASKGQHQRIAGEISHTLCQSVILDGAFDDSPLTIPPRIQPAVGHHQNILERWRGISGRTSSQRTPNRRC
ncbi:hypothetical protein MJ575_24855 [Klebsiella pneumoniae]|nr:hypothetical protein MJ575_24855 [Klebsiella pneumoniae]